MRRREFISVAAFGTAGSAFAVTSKPQTDGAVRFCAFADLHYWPRCYPNDSTEFLDRILDRASAKKCDFTIQLGDMVHDVRKWRAFVDRYTGFGKMPTYSVIGNHEDEFTSHEEVLDALHLERGYYFFDKGGFRFIATDPNYIRRETGEYVHFAKWNWRKDSRPGDTRFWIPDDQMEWLEQTILRSPHPCVVFSHESYERPGGDGVKNQAAVRALFAKANAASPGKIRLVVNGHDHTDNLRILEGVPYLDLNSANYWYAMGKKHDKYPAEYTKVHGGASLTYAYDAPLSAVITLYPSGRISIEGAEAGFLFGVTPKDSGHRGYDDCGRQAAARIQSVDFTVCLPS